MCMAVTSIVGSAVEDPVRDGPAEPAAGEDADRVQPAATK
jgi:hypothetical protein